MFISPRYRLEQLTYERSAQLYLFFCLFNVVGQTSSFIGPFITARIIDDHEGNQSYAFAFLFPMFVSFVPYPSTERSV